VKLTRKQREQVVELLRCAADERSDGVGINGMWDGSKWLGVLVGSRLSNAAWDALDSITCGHDYDYICVGRVDERYRHRLLEAAALVEEGSWP
jgi:hypothetical protein